ncbi:flagellar basal-body MS-ring/collar protein FliF [Enterovirga sp. DB1703]|nr:flagellar basal-body MS-ring/collar protein FliF [Enterovirga sp. DB1703]
MGAVTLALIGFFAFVILRVSQPAMGVLFTDLAGGDTGSIIRDLDARGIRYETRDDGQTILVPRSDIAKIRMELAGKGLPSGGGVGYEIFDKGDAFSTTSFVQNINHLRALEGELARTIRTIGRVQSARVHLALPERRLFARDKEAARASIVLKLRGELAADQVQAIRHLVASAVEGLTPENISIIDERGRLLANGSGGADALGTAATEEKRVALERRLRAQVEEIVAGVVGVGRSRVQVAAEFDFSRIESRLESFDPESRVVRSTQTRGENASTANAENQVSVGNELPGARDAQPAAQPAPKDVSSKNEETINYEISRTTRTEIQQAGRLKRLSVAVLVDGVYGRGPGGETAYQPRGKEELERIAALVRTAVGFDGSRGDQVEVVNLPFAEGPQIAEGEKASLLASLLNPTKEDILHWVELGIISLLVLVVLLLVVRPMVKQIVAPAAALLAPPPSLALAGDGADLAALPQPGQAESYGKLAINSLQNAEQVVRINDLAEGNPKQAAAVLRSWMAQG